MRSLFLVLAALTVSVGAASAGAARADAIADRQAIMKDMGRSVGAIAPMVKGAKPFDGAAAIAALEKIAADAQKIDVDALFPAGSDQGKTEASPKIWQDKAEFVKHVDKLKSDSAAAAAAKPQDLAALKTAFQQVASNCGSCHQAFRLKKD